MCGIVAVISNNSETKMIKCLEQMQNRGYCGAGMCTVKNNNFIITKFASVDEIKDHRLPKFER